MKYEIGQFLHLQARKCQAQKHSEVPLGETFVGQIVSPYSVLVYTSHAQPTIQSILDYNIIGQMISNEDISNQICQLSIANIKLTLLSNSIQTNKFPGVADVLVNGPATIFFFEDGEKVVVVKTEDDFDDFEKAFAIACAKKAYGNYSRFKEELDKFAWDEEDEV